LGSEEFPDVSLGVCARNWPNLSREGIGFLGVPSYGPNRAGFLGAQEVAGSLGDFKKPGFSTDHVDEAVNGLVGGTALFERRARTNT